MVMDDAGRLLRLISDADAVARVQSAAQRSVIQALRSTKNVVDDLKKFF